MQLSAHQRLIFFAAVVLCAGSTGCLALPDRVLEPQFHNPFPQIYRVAVLPFFNQSADPTVDGEAVAMAYYNELQNIPGFEVMPVGVAKQMLAASMTASGREPRSGIEFQRLARQMGVDAVLVGSVTEFSPYYPPRMGLSVDWFAANPSFHPIPAGYGLPWGRAEEEYIPSTLVQEAEFALAREQLKTQTPGLLPDPVLDGKIAPAGHTGLPSSRGSASPTPSHTAANTPTPASRVGSGAIASTAQQSPAGAPQNPHQQYTPPGVGGIAADGSGGAAMLPGDRLAAQPALPENWPDPRGFIPLPPASHPPHARPQAAPIMTHTRIYHGQDAKFTERLATYYYLRDDARFGGWPAYLERPSDFIRFCCYLHVTETLAARGGTGDARVVYRWPIRRYER
jgi:hypothetical protein